ncbi:MAG: sugar phosphate isomerase/epimerase family protein [Armatimonadota bacterium]
MYKENIRIGTLVPGSNGSADYIRQILPNGFESFSLTFGGTLGDTNLQETAAKVKDVIGSDAVISSVCCYSNPLLDTPEGEETRKTWMNLIDAAESFGCNIVGGFAGRVVGVPIDQSMDQYVKVFGALAKYAADKGVRLAFENCDMGGTWATGDWNIAQTPAAWDMMFDALPAENVGLQWEPCHQMVKLIDPMPQLRKYVSKIFHLHGKDATIYKDVIREHGVYGPKQFAFHRTPGFGDSNWTDIITELRMGGFVGSIDIEGWHDPVYRAELEMMGQVHGLNYLKQCRGGSFVQNPG